MNWPSLENLFIAPCFRKVTTYHLQNGTVIKADDSVQNCLMTSIWHYGWLLTGVAAIVCFAYIIRAGYIMFTAFGDEAKHAMGKKTLLYAIIGLAIAIASGFIINFFVGLLGYTP